MELTNAKYIHFIGIGGIGTSSLAQILHNQGKKISGSDMEASQTTKSLKLSKIKADIGHKASNISKKHEIVVYSQAIPSTNIELQKAKTLKIPTLTYAQALGELTKQYYTIAIAGTHGKSTTTAMIARILTHAGLDPTVVIGTKMREFKNRNFKIGNSNYLIIEACEYKDSFLNFSPNMLIITNIEAEHLDYFKNLKNYKKAFAKLIERVPKDGTIIINNDDINSKSAAKESKSLVLRWGKKKNLDFYLKNDELHYIDIIEKKDKAIKLSSGVPGNFNLRNAAAAAITANILNIEDKKISAALKGFKGTWRRMEYKRKKAYECKFIDDYAHHPTEIELTLNAIREKHPKDKILCVFQPHQYSRTKALLKEFGPVFTQVDELIIPNIYRVRDSEKDVVSVSVDDLIREVKKYQKKAKNGKSLEKTAEFIKTNNKKYGLIVTMGAGNITNIYKML